MVWKVDPRKAVEAQKLFAARHPERVRATQRKKYVARREELLARAKTYAAANAERVRAYQKAYRQSPEGRLARRNCDNRRRAQKRNLEATATNAEIKSLMLGATHCAYCRAPFSADKKPTLDHVIPLSKGGAHSIGNLAAACMPCNLEKGSKMNFQKDFT